MDGDERTNPPNPHCYLPKRIFSRHETAPTSKSNAKENPHLTDLYSNDPPPPIPLPPPSLHFVRRAGRRRARIPRHVPQTRTVPKTPKAPPITFTPPSASDPIDQIEPG